MRFFIYSLPIIAVLLGGCQPTVYLMPTPEGIVSAQSDPFELNSSDLWDQQVTVAYATNRLPVGLAEDRNYVTLFDDNIRLGVSHIQIGAEELSRRDLQELSTSAKRGAKLPLKLDRADEKARQSAAVSSTSLTPEAQDFFTKINTALERTETKNLLVYVHGANNNFYRSMAQAAQFHYFTGRELVVLAFSWPSAESLLRYAVDVNNARETVPVFVQFLDLLAANTEAQKIDLLAYSAGAQVLSPALAQLRQDNAAEDASAMRERFRLGEIYFAAPDVDFRGFLNDLSTYIGVVDHVTLAINPGDFVLGMAASQHGVSRAGRPDPTELTPEERDQVSRATREMPFDVLWVDPDTIPGLSGGSHDFWYSHPWVSTDVLLQLLFRARPEERGLAEVPDNEARVWYFPPDYADHVGDLVRRFDQQHEAKRAEAAGTATMP